MNGASFADSATPAAADRGKLDADMRQRVVDEHQLQDQRRAAEDHRVGAREPGQRPRTRPSCIAANRSPRANPPVSPSPVTSSVTLMPGAGTAG